MKPTDNKIIKLRNSDGSNSDDNTFVTLKEIFTNSDFGGVRDYFICDYQRPYVWSKREIDDFIKDIDTNKPHFTGTMYFGKHATNHGYPIIDGQQRFTTILLILKKINEKLLEQKKCSERFNEINFDNFKISLRYDSKYYELFPTFNDGEAKNNNLMECYGVNLKNAKKIIEESLAGKNLEKILKSIVNNLYFLFIQCEDDRSEKILFRLINAKGKRLDDIDNIKACLLSDIYTTDEDTSKFMKLWAQVNKVINKKNVTKSINSFMKNLWIDINRELGISKKGKIKFKEFSNFCDKIKNDLKKTTDFKANFEKYVENFAWFALSNNEIWSVNNSNNSKEWQYFQACNYLIRDCGIKDRFEDEIRKKINEYKANYESIFRLFLLYFFTYIIEGYTYSSSANKKVDEFEQLDENGRKDKIFDLWTRIKNENILDKTYYNVKSITGEISNIKKIHKTIRTWLILGNCSPNLHDFYAFVNQNREKVLDHYFPKNPTHKGFGGAKKIDKNVSDKILDDIKNDKEFSKKLNSLYNIVLLNNGVNCWKNNTVPSEFLEESDDGMITNIKYDELEKRWVVNKTQIIKNIDIIVDRLKR